MKGTTRNINMKLITALIGKMLTLLLATVPSLKPIRCCFKKRTQCRKIFIFLKELMLSLFDERNITTHPTSWFTVVAKKIRIWNLLYLWTTVHVLAQMVDKLIVYFPSSWSTSSHIWLYIFKYIHFSGKLPEMLLEQGRMF